MSSAAVQSWRINGIECTTEREVEIVAELSKKFRERLDTETRRMQLLQAAAIIRATGVSVETAVKQAVELLRSIDAVQHVTFA